jgi:hypothetical protein
MPLTLIKEDGTGKPDSNSYAAVADGDAYHDAHLYASSWTNASTANKEKALVMATRLIDGFYQFSGFKRLSTQALQWPRRECRDPDNTGGVIPGMVLTYGPYIDETKVPPTVLNAACELARELIKQDRTDDPDGEGVAQIALVGSVNVTFDKGDRQPVIPHVVQTMLAKFGSLISSGSAKLVRT